MEFFCYHRDRPGSVALREHLLEDHWSYMDQFAAGMIARGPTLTGDGDNKDHDTGIFVSVKSADGKMPRTVWRTTSPKAAASAKSPACAPSGTRAATASALRRSREPKRTE